MLDTEKRFIVEVSPFVPVDQKGVLQQTIVHTEKVAKRFDTYEEAQTALVEVCADKGLRTSAFQIVEAA